MDGKKEYKIVINGISESIDGVTALNKQLETLDSRIKALEKSSVKINSSGGSTKASNASSLSEEEKLAKQIEQIDAKRVAYSKEVYQNYLAAKDVLKETVEDQKQIAAQERLQSDTYANTMAGMKQKLADIKSVMQTVDLGDTDTFQKMTKDANDLNSKLLEIEKSYGQYGRQVGNYANGVAEGLQKVKIAVGDDVREFDNAKQAAKTLGNELKTMAVNGQQGTKEFKNLQQAVAQLSSDIKDATVSSKGMDNLLDTMQSFAALGQISQGFSALFGFDDDQIQKSIQKLVALQSVMEGIEKLNQQINSQEGIGGWLAKGNSMIDSFVAKITGANKAQEALNKSTTAGVTASKSLAAAETAQATATAGATVATKALSFALKALGIGLIISAVATLITYWEDIYDWFTDTIPALKNLATWFDKIKAVAVGVGTAILNYMVQPLVTLVKTIQAVINGNFSEIPNIISEGMKKTFDLAGNYQKGYNKETERQQKVHNNKMLKQQKEANDEWLADQEAKYGKSYENTKKYLNQQMELINKQLANSRKGSKEYDALIKEQKEIQRKIWENDRTEREKRQKQAEKNNKEYAKDEAEAQKTLTDLEIRLMKEGLNKKLRQLDEEERQTINKLKSNGRITADELRRIQKSYSQLRIKEIQEYLKDAEEKIKDSADNIKKIQFDINTTEFDNKIDALRNEMDELNKLNMGENTLSPLSSRSDLKEKQKEEIKNYGKSSIVRIDDNQLQKSFESQYSTTAQFYKGLIDLLIDYTKEEKDINEERIREQERQQKDAESDRYSIQMSGLTEQRQLIKEGLAAIEKEYEVYGLEGIETIKDTNKEIYEQYNDLFAKTVEIDAQIETAKKQHKQKIQQITEAANNAIKKNELDTQKDISNTQERYYNLQITNFRKLQSKINTEMDKQPVTDLIGFGIVNLSESKKNYDEIKNAALTALEAIKQARNELDNSLSEGLISDEAADATKTELDDLEKSFKDTYSFVEGESRDLVGNFIASTQQYLQAAMDSFQTIMSAVWDAQDIAFEKEQEQLDKENELLDKKLDEQQEIIEQHKDAIDSIEDELATSRGDRRQHLIDQLNAEIAAERAAQKEEQRIQKQKEAQQKKQDALDLKRKKAQYNRDMIQAIVNGAMAVTYAAINKWPIPAIPMMALAASTTAAQLAIMASNKPYAKGGQLDGGVAQGKRHSEGGIPVLGGRASIEGGEFITNRQTTAKNVDLLEYINAKHRKLNIDDFIDFYSSGNAKKNFLASSPRQKFADGGVIPTLNNEYQFDDRLLSAFEDYSNRPVYVSVVDINSRQAAVKNVQVLAGISEE